MKHVIIGGVAGGATAAARIRRADESAEIILLEKGKYISYANCGLPYYIGGSIADREKLFVQTARQFGKRFAIDVRTENEVVDIDTENKRITIQRADGSQYTETYDKLLLSPGASPVRPPLPGIDLEGIFTLRNVEDTDRIKTYLDTHTAQTAVVVGGGFIGLEMAENLAVCKSISSKWATKCWRPLISPWLHWCTNTSATKGYSSIWKRRSNALKQPNAAWWFA